MLMVNLRETLKNILKMVSTSCTLYHLYVLIAIYLCIVGLGAMQGETRKRKVCF